MITFGPLTLGCSEAVSQVTMLDKTSEDVHDQSRQPLRHWLVAMPVARPNQCGRPLCSRIGIDEQDLEQ
jgi:hypothetical protein